MTEAQARLGETRGRFFGGLDDHAYLLALTGLAPFDGGERVTVRSRDARRERKATDAAGVRAFWLSIGSIALYTGLIGYARSRRKRPRTTGRSSRSRWRCAPLHGERLRVASAPQGGVHAGRTVASRRHRAGGWLLSKLTDVPETALMAVLAFLAGGVVLDVLKEELPDRRRSRFSAFALGTVGYAAVLQIA